MNVTFTEDGFSEYVEWQTLDKKTLKRINSLIKSIQRDGVLDGLGKPERLKGRPEYSRRIDDYNRLTYVFGDDGSIIITSCKGHYE